MLIHPDLIRIIADDRRVRAERMARESRTRRDHKRYDRHR
jgi:hypothetical protein